MHMRLLNNGYRLSDRNNTWILQVLNYDCCREAFLVRRYNMKTLWFSVAKHKTTSPSLELWTLFAGHILRKHVKCFGDLHYQYTIFNEKLTASTLELLVRRKAFTSVEQLKIAPPIAYRTIQYPIRDLFSNEVHFLQGLYTRSIQRYGGDPRDDSVSITDPNNVVHDWGVLKPRLTTQRYWDTTSKEPAMVHRCAVQIVESFTIGVEKGVWHWATVHPTKPDYCRYI